MSLILQLAILINELFFSNSNIFEISNETIDGGKNYQCLIKMLGAELYN